MSLTKFTGATNTIQSLSDRPNQNEGFTAAQVKIKFDQHAIDNEAYLNDVLTPELDELDSKNVKIIGNQSIAGVKTFTLSPIVPTPTTSTQAANKAFVENTVSVADAENDINLALHKESSDHDGRYYTEAEINTLLASKTNLTGDHQGTWQGYTPTQTSPGIQAVVDSHTLQLSDNAISPDQFTGTDFSKVQQAIDYAIANNKAIRFSRMYNITGMGSLNIDKVGTGRKILYLLGVGGGIQKDDSGYVYTTTLSQVSDIVSDKIKYQSVNNGGTKVWNGNKIIGLTCLADCYINVDGIFEANTTYAQTISFLKCKITGGQGWAFEWKKSYDVTIDSLIEHRQHGIRNTVFTGNPDNDNLRIVNCVIEGLTGKAIELGSSFAVLIEGNYMEANTGGYIELLPSSGYHNGLTIIGNSCQQTADQITNDVPFIDLKNIGNNSVLSSGNSATGVLYKLYPDGTAGRLVSVGDISYNDKKAINNPLQLSELGRLTNYTSPVGVGYGRVSSYRLVSGDISFAAGEIKEVVITPGLILSGNDIITPYIASASGGYTIKIHNMRWSVVSHTITIRVENNGAGVQNISVGANVMQIK